MKKKDTKEYEEGQPLDFLNEHVVKDIRKDLSGYVRLVLLLTLLISVTALVVYLCLNSEIRSLRDRLNEKSMDENPLFADPKTGGEKSAVPSTADRETDSVTASRDGQPEDERDRELPLSPEQMSDAVVVVKYDLAGEDGILKSKKKAGAIIANDKEVLVLVYDSGLQKGMEAEVFLWGTSERGKVACVYEDYKIAVIKVPKENIEDREPEDMLPVLMATEEEFARSDEILLIGNPKREKNIIEKGRLTLKENTVSILDGTLLLADTDVNGGDEESAFVFNEYGILLGIAGVDTFSGKVYVIAIQDFRTYLDKIIAEEKLPYIGIYGREVTEDVIANLDNIDKDIPYGIYISNRKDNSPAYKAGIMNGDILVAVAGRPALNFDEYRQVLLSCKAGQTVSVKVMRKGKDGYKKISYEVVVGELD